MVYQEDAMDIDLPTEHGPTEETVEALMDYLVGPLLPLKVSDITTAPSESQQKSVAKQVHAVAVLYNYYHRIHHRESEFLKFDQFCCLAIMFKPNILHHLKYMSKTDRPVLDDPEIQLSLAEKAIMDACTTSETLLDATTTNSSCSVKEWPISKVAVLLIDSKKENCFLQFNDGVWSLIEKDLYSEKEIEKKRLRKYNEDEEVGFAFMAVKEATGIIYNKLKVLNSDVVYSLSHPKTCTHFYVMQSTQSINEDNLVPIQDTIRSLQGPVVKKCSGSWIITPVVEYYYLLPYADIISKLFSRVSNSVPHQVEKGSEDTSSFQGSLITCEIASAESKKLSDNLKIKSKLDLGSVHSSKSIKKEARDHNFSEHMVLDDVVTSKLIKKPFDQKVKQIESSISNKIKSTLDVGSVHSCNSSNEEAHDHNVALNLVDPKCEPMVLDELIGKPFDQKVKETESFAGNKITGANGDSKKLFEIGSGESKELSDNLIIKSNLDVGIVHSSNSIKEEAQDHNVALNFVNPNYYSEPVSEVLDDVTCKLIVKPFDQEVKESESSVGNKITDPNGKSCEIGMGESKKVSDNLIIMSNIDVGSVHSSNINKKEAHDHNVALNVVNANNYNEPISKVLEMEKPFDQKVNETESSFCNKITGANGDSKNSCKIGSGQSKKVKETESSVGNRNFVNPNNYCEPISEVLDDVVTTKLIGKPFDQKVKETESSVGNKITGANGDSKKSCEIASGENKKVNEYNSNNYSEPMVLDDSNLIGKPIDQKVKETESSVCNKITGTNDDGMKKNNMNGSCKVESSNSSSGTNSEGIDKPYKVYHHIKRKTKAINIKENLKDTKNMSMSTVSQKKEEKVDSEKNSCMVLCNEGKVLTLDHACKDFHLTKNMSTVSQKKDEKVDGETSSRMVLFNEDKILTVDHACEDYHLTHNKSTVSQKKEEKVDGEKNSCMVLYNEDKILTVDHAHEDFHLTVDAKRSELSKAALRALLHKRQKLCDQQHYIENELTLCDKKIQAIMHAADGDCLGIKIETLIDCCNEICQLDNKQPQQHTNLLHGDRSLALSENSKACQELDELCLSNSWTLPSYRTTCSNGMYVANVTVKGLKFECSGAGSLQPSMHEAKNSAATHLIMKLQQMAGELNTALN